MKNLLIAAFMAIVATTSAGASQGGPAGSSASPVAESLAQSDDDCLFALDQCQEYCQTTGADPRPCLKACAKEYLECINN